MRRFDSCPVSHPHETSGVLVEGESVQNRRSVMVQILPPSVVRSSVIYTGRDFELNNADGREILLSRRWDHIITDPDYENQPPVQPYLEQCSGNVLIFCDPTKRPCGPNPQEVLFWTKPMSTKWTTKRCAKFIEEILVYRGKHTVFNTLHWSSMTGIFTDGFVEKPFHPFGKPPSLVEKLVLMYTKPGDLVFDPFCGAGTVGAACLKHGRKFVGCENDRKYYEMARKAFV